MASTPTSSPLSQHTSMTSPPQASPSAITPDANDNDTSDIWAIDSPPEPTSNTLTPRQPELSDLPALRRQHITSGYREGLAVGKAKVIQSSFDAGYPIGVSLALRAGTVLGVLDGLSATQSVRHDERRRKVVEQMVQKARRELDVKSLLAGVEDRVVAGAEDVKGLEQVQEVVGRWEGEVLGAWGRGGEGGGLEAETEMKQ